VSVTAGSRSIAAAIELQAVDTALCARDGRSAQGADSEFWNLPAIWTDSRGTGREHTWSTLEAAKACRQCAVDLGGQSVLRRKAPACESWSRRGLSLGGVGSRAGHLHTPKRAGCSARDRLPGKSTLFECSSEQLAHQCQWPLSATLFVAAIPGIGAWAAGEQCWSSASSPLAGAPFSGATDEAETSPIEAPKGWFETGVRDSMMTTSRLVVGPLANLQRSAARGHGSRGMRCIWQKSNLVGFASTLQRSKRQTVLGLTPGLSSSGESRFMAEASEKWSSATSFLMMARFGPARTGHWHSVCGSVLRSFKLRPCCGPVNVPRRQRNRQQLVGGPWYTLNLSVAPTLQLLVPGQDFKHRLHRWGQAR
jgi:hypothetical protein